MLVDPRPLLAPADRCLGGGVPGEALLAPGVVGLAQLRLAVVLAPPRRQEQVDPAPLLAVPGPPERNVPPAPQQGDHVQEAGLGPRLADIVEEVLLRPAQPRPRLGPPEQEG